MASLFLIRNCVQVPLSPPRSLYSLVGPLPPGGRLITVAHIGWSSKTDARYSRPLRGREPATNEMQWSEWPRGKGQAFAI